MSFAINARISDERQVFYFLFTPPSEGCQEIYENFLNISELFNQCYSADLQYNPALNESQFTRGIFHSELYVFGFIYELLSIGIENGNAKIVPRTGPDVCKLLVEKKLHEKRPIFIIDECIAITDASFKKVCFVRQCFRVLGLGLVLLGTDSRAAKLPEVIGGMSRSGDPKPWCFIFGNFPRFDLKLLEDRSDIEDWVKNILQNSRPLFATLVSSQSLFEKDFNSICKIAFLKLIKTKPIFENYHGKLGQLRLFQNAHYSFKDINNQSTPLIHSHFAQLNGVGKNLTLLTNSFAEKSGTKWNPSSIFPEIEEDILLYLILMGGLNFSAFNEASKPVPYAYFLMKARNDLNHRSHVLDFSNSNQTSNDGMFLESLLCATVCLASHTNGFQGVPLKSFLLNLLYQLQNEKIEYDDVSLADFDLIEDKFRLDIPYFSPPNQKWPSYLNIPNSNMQNLERTKNKDKVDLRSSCGLVGESKDYQSDININTMRQILKRVPQEAKLELVFVRKLQNSYFQGVSFEEEFAESHLLNKSFFRIDASKPATSIENIIGLPTGNYDGIVLFIEIDKSISSNIIEK